MLTNLESILPHLQVIHQALPVVPRICHLGLDPLHPVFGHNGHQQLPTGSYCTQSGLAMFPVTQELLWGTRRQRQRNCDYLTQAHT